MKVWSRDKYIEVTLQAFKQLDRSEAVSVRHVMGKNLSIGLPTIGNPYSYVDDVQDFNSSLGGLFSRFSINDIDTATSLLLSNTKKSNKSKIDELASQGAAAFLKSSANIATFKKKNKSPNKDKLALYEFFAKMALNSIVEFNASEERTANAH